MTAFHHAWAFLKVHGRLCFSDPAGVVLRADDPLAPRDDLRLDALADRRWFRFPDGTDSIWRAYWNAWLVFCVVIGTGVHGHRPETFCDPP